MAEYSSKLKLCSFGLTKTLGMTRQSISKAVASGEKRN